MTTHNPDWNARKGGRARARGRAASSNAAHVIELGQRARSVRGFTLVELVVVMIIISILLGFIFVAATDAAHRAEERATQTLITKLEQGVSDRLEVLLQNVPEPNFPTGTWPRSTGAIMKAFRH